MKIFRKKIGANQSNFAKSINIPQSYISKIESGELNISSNILTSLVSEYPELNIHWLWSGVGEMLLDKTQQVGLKPFSPPTGNIFVPISAKAGYLENLGQEFINQELHYIFIPSIKGEARTFEVEGDSMYPILKHKDFVVCRRVEDWDNINDRHIYVFITTHPDCEIVIKHAQKFKEGFNLISENEINGNKFIPFKDVLEIWEVALKITNSLLPPEKYLRNETLEEKVNRLEQLIKDKNG